MEPIIIETLDILKQYIPRLLESSENMAESLQGGDQQKAMQQLPQFFEGMEWVASAISGISKNGYQTGIEVSIINKHLFEIEEALKNQDLILLADLLEYEIKPILEDWLDKCTAFLE